jgi:hypothetical protein
VSVRGIKIEPRYDDLVIGTHGVGAWILDDLGPLAGLRDAMGEPLHLFPIREATDWEEWDRDSSLGQSTFLGENPEEGAYVNVWVGPGAMAGSGTDGTATLRITDGRGRAVRTMEDLEIHPGVNRIVWDMTWDEAEPIPGVESRESRWYGSSGPPAAPGTYTATLLLGEGEVSGDFRVRGDPEVEASPSDYQARTEAALRARELETRVNRMIGALAAIERQVEALTETLEGKEVTQREEILRRAREVREEADALENELRRPPPRMGYRQWPRLSEQLSFVNRGITGAQARPTEGQLQVLSELEEAAESREAELRGLLEGPVAELNRMLKELPGIVVGWSG